MFGCWGTTILFSGNNYATSGESTKTNDVLDVSNLEARFYVRTRDHSAKAAKLYQLVA